MRKLIFFFLTAFLLTPLFSWADSAYRHPYEASEAAAYRVMGPYLETSGTPYSTRVGYSELNYQSVPQWTHDQLQAYFYYVRNLRFLNDPTGLVKRRRLSWMYPDDGCWIRAQIMNSIFRKIGAQPLAKVFIFGNLKVATLFSPSRSVSWWYHVVPMVRVDNQIYVIDPAIEISRPLLFVEWAQRQGDLNSHKFSICAPETYGPRDNCYTPKPKLDERVFSDIEHYLVSEAHRLQRLGLDAKVYLDQTPPWPEGPYSCEGIQQAGRCL